MRVAELWRYPVKSLRGEALQEATLTPLGIDGDRLVHARRPAGRVYTARTHPAMLGLQGVLDDEGVATIDGARWDTLEALSAVRAVTADDAELVFYDGDGPQRFDVLPVSLATDGGVAAVGVDGRRFRANIHLEGVAGLAEREWVGRSVRLGQAVVARPLRHDDIRPGHARAGHHRAAADRVRARRPNCARLLRPRARARPRRRRGGGAGLVDAAAHGSGVIRETESLA
jgi:hypothetical protein